MDQDPTPTGTAWLHHPEGFIVYRYFDTVEKKVFYSLQKGATGGYYIWKSMVKQKGLNPADFLPY